MPSGHSRLDAAGPPVQADGMASMSLSNLPATFLSPYGSASAKGISRKSRRAGAARRRTC